MSSIRFLIADPITALQTFLRQRLERYGMEAELIKTTSNPTAALDIATEFKPDFLITDVFANEAMSGIELFKQIQQSSPECLFALVGKDKTPELEQQAQDAGALFFLKKPFTPEELRTELQKALEKLSTQHPKIAQYIHAQPKALTSMRPKFSDIVLPPAYKPGDSVIYQNQAATVKYVIVRKGELVVQLQGNMGLVPATKLRMHHAGNSH